MPLLGNGVVLSNRVSRPPRDGVASGARGCHRPARGRGTGRGRRLRSRRVGHRHGGILPGFDDIGIDFHGPSVATARERADEAAVAGRASFEVASATGYDGAYDLICFFDCLHDMGDPVSVARHAREHLVPGGTVLLVEPFAIYGRAGNVAQNPMAPLVCTVSSAIYCRTRSRRRLASASMHRLVKNGSERSSRTPGSHTSDARPRPHRT
jgi:SAM-dependent methyltransferase